MKSEVDDAGRHKKADGSETTLLRVDGRGRLWPPRRHLAGLRLRLLRRLRLFRATAYGDYADADVVVSIYL